jgi:hypothetical protein
MSFDALCEAVSAAWERIVEAVSCFVEEVQQMFAALELAADHSVTYSDARLLLSHFNDVALVDAALSACGGNLAFAHAYAGLLWQMKHHRSKP